MLVTYLHISHKTRRMVVFESEDHTDAGILYVSKPAWEAMGRPEEVVVEVTPQSEYDN